MAMHGSGPWGSGQELFNRFARIDPYLARVLTLLSKDQSNDIKLEAAVEAGRVYGLQQQRYAMILKKELNRDWRTAPTAKDW